MQVMAPKYLGFSCSTSSLRCREFPAPNGIPESKWSPQNPSSLRLRLASRQAGSWSGPIVRREAPARYWTLRVARSQAGLSSWAQLPQSPLQTQLLCPQHLSSSPPTSLPQALPRKEPQGAPCRLAGTATRLGATGDDEPLAKVVHLSQVGWGQQRAGEKTGAGESCS